MDVIPVQTQNMAVLNWLKFLLFFVYKSSFCVSKHHNSSEDIRHFYFCCVDSNSRTIVQYATTAEDIPANKHGVRETEWTYVYIH